MEIYSAFSGNEDFTFVSIFLALILTLICSLFPLRLLKLSQSDRTKVCKCVCFSYNTIGGGCDLMAITEAAMTRMMNGGGGVVVVDRVGASIMEQLVPEITTHVLSYLDYRSLCSLSMTNSSMRRAANDDNAWKTLYRKDFTMEQDGITPVNGWKAYYAATRAIVNINQQFFDILRQRSLPEMGRLWLNADYVKCVHASGDIFTGYNRVLRSWQRAFNWEQPGFQVRDVSARVLTDMAWVTMKAYVGLDQCILNLTNMFEFHHGRWYMVHHHSSHLLLNNGELPPMLA